MDLLAVFYILLCGTVAYGLTSSDKDSIECTNGDGNYPIPGTCDSDFYFCYNDVPYLQHCPTGSIFDPDVLNCVQPENASCNKPTTESSTSLSTTESSTPITSSTTSTTTEGTTSTSTESTSTTTTESTTITTASSTITSTSSTTMAPFNCPQENGFFPIPGAYCGPDYYSCVAGSPYAETCPGVGSIFDPVALKCVLEENASCIPGTSFQCPATDGVYPYPDDCTRFVICTNQEIASIGSCTPPLVFNPANHLCDYLSNVPDCQ